MTPLMHRLLLTFLIVPLSLLFAQPADVESMLYEVDLSILDNPQDKSTTSHHDVPADHLFFQFEALPTEALQPPLAEKDADADTDAETQSDEESATTLIPFTLPEATYLIVPNTARIDQAYLSLAEALHLMELTPTFPLKVVLHADGNYSVAVALKEAPTSPLPLSVDLSPLQEARYVAVEADIQQINKEHPPVLEAFTRLREAAHQAHITIDRSEFYFFPLSPGKVWFALRVKE
ncbi:hypothetical protein P3T73_09460 [Kiritimatiellota bacterium B12222]|nr:hypothetical protein P3T73_09460 [Kiritimatiellota bacterium B12222]